jgi:hypothetical protein
MQRLVMYCGSGGIQEGIMLLQFGGRHQVVW